MNYVSIPGLSQRHARMPLKAEQHCHIAAAYDKAAFDISLPAHTRVAFARKADWFRLLARVAEKRERATLPTDAARKPQEAPLEIGRATSELQSHVNLVCRLLLEKKKKNNIHRS